MLPVCHYGLLASRSGVQNLQVLQVQSSIDLPFTYTLLCVCWCCSALFFTVGRIFSAFVWWSPWQLLIEQSKEVSLFPAAAAVRRQAELFVCLFCSLPATWRLNCILGYICHVQFVFFLDSFETQKPFTDERPDYSGLAKCCSQSRTICCIKAPLPVPVPSSSSSSSRKWLDKTARCYSD